MKISLTILIILLPAFSFAQNLRERIEKLPLSYHSGCDTSTHTPQQGWELGELDLVLSIQTAEKKGKTISMAGMVKDKITGEPVPYIEVFTATFQEDYCDILSHLSTTDNQGRFSIKFENSESLSLFFDSLGFRGLELKIGDLRKGKPSKPHQPEN